MDRREIIVAFTSEASSNGDIAFGGLEEFVLKQVSGKPGHSHDYSMNSLGNTKRTVDPSLRDYKTSFSIAVKILDIARSIDQNGLALKQTLEAIVQGVDLMIKNDEVRLFLVEKICGEKYMRVVSKKGVEIKHVFNVNYKDSSARKIIEGNKPILLNRKDMKPGDLGYISSMMIPIKGNIQAVLNLNSGFCLYNEDDMKLASYMIDMLSVKIENCAIFEKAAYYDPMTELHNLRYLERDYENLITACKLNKMPVTYIMIDVNNFKKINDNYSHMIGDEMLKLTARVLRDIKRQCDILIRRGGSSDEFIYVLPNMGRQDTLAFLSRIDSKIQEWNDSYEKFRTPELLGFNPSINRAVKDIFLSLSMGVATSEKGYDHFNMRAEEAMYEAKRRYKTLTGLVAQRSNSTYFED